MRLARRRCGIGQRTGQRARDSWTRHYSPPQVVHAVRATYTPEARSAGIEGTARVDAVVLTDGSVGDDVRIVQSLDSAFELDDQALKASKQWRFKPATRDGKPVAAHVVIEHLFTLRRSNPTGVSRRRSASQRHRRMKPRGLTHVEAIDRQWLASSAGFPQLHHNGYEQRRSACDPVRAGRKYPSRLHDPDGPM